MTTALRSPTVSSRSTSEAEQWLTVRAKDERPEIRVLEENWHAVVRRMNLAAAVPRRRSRLPRPKVADPSVLVTDEKVGELDAAGRATGVDDRLLTSEAEAGVAVQLGDARETGGEVQAARVRGVRGKGQRHGHRNKHASPRHGVALTLPFPSTISKVNRTS